MHGTRLKHIMHENGERAVLLTSSTGIPLYYPNLYITTQVRSASMALATAKVSLTAIQLLEEWLRDNDIDLFWRFHNGAFLKSNELDSLRDICQKNASRTKKTIKSNINTAIGITSSVSRNTQYQRMTIIAKYLTFLAITINQKNIDEDFRIRRENMIEYFKRLRPRQSSPYKTEKLDRALSKETTDQLYEITKESHPANPFEKNVQLRNALILEILTSLGMRKGEIANIRLDDIDLQSNTLKVVRRPDDVGDRRKYQPVVKTSERTLPFSSNLGLLIQEYQLSHRGKLAAAKKHGYLFVSHKGSSEGLPLTISGIDYIFRRLKVAVSDSSLSPHRLRHQWNYEFSQAIDNSPKPLTEAQEEQMRSYLMGWTPTSGMASTYNRRRIREKAHDAIRAHQKRIKVVED